jgi:hypothetical protein
LEEAELVRLFVFDGVITEGVVDELVAAVEGVVFVALVVLAGAGRIGWSSGIGRIG